MEEINQPVSTSGPLQSTLPTPSAKSSRWLKISIIGGAAVLFLTLVSSVIYLIAAKKSAQKPVACTQETKECPNGSWVGRTGPNCAFTPCPNPAPDPTANPDQIGANWKTFTSKDSEVHKFKIRYPSNWTYFSWKDKTDPTYGNNQLDLYIIDFGDPSQKTSLGELYPIIRLQYITSPDISKMSIEEFLNQENIANYNPVLENTIVDGLEAKKIEHKGCLSGFCLDVAFKKDSTIFLIGIPEQANDEDRLNYFNQILSTFKFLDEINNLEITGFIRTSGLNKEEKGKLGLRFSDYQIVYLGNKDNSEASRYYLESDNFSFNNYLGKCARILGNIKSGWGKVSSKNFMFNQQYTYQGLAFLPTKLNILDYSNCQGATINPPSTNEKKVSLRGIIKYATRPAPDIAYDYILELSFPFTDDQSSAGSPRPQTKVDVIPINDTILIELEKNIGKEATIEGSMAWGYSESRYLAVTKIY